MKILTISSCSGDSFGRTVPELVIGRHMLKQNHEMPFVVHGDGRFAAALRELGTEVLVRSYAGQARKLWNRAAMVFGAAALARRFADVDCVVGFRMSSCPLALGIGRRLGLPVLAYLHGYTKRDKYLRYGVPRADHVVAVSERVLDTYVRETEGIRPAEQGFQYIVNGMDAEEFRASAAGMDARAELGIPPDVELVGMAGADARKGTDIFIEAAIQVAAVRPETHFLVASAFRSPEFESMVVGRAEEAGLGGRVHWVGFQENIAAIMQAADVWTMPSRNDSFPLAGLEAQAAGTPLVASRVGGVPEMILEGETGFLFPAEDPGALAERLLILLGDPELRAKMGRRGEQHVREKFLVQTQVEAFERCLEELIRRKAPSPPQEA